LDFAQPAKLLVDAPAIDLHVRNTKECRRFAGLTRFIKDKSVGVGAD
jgi:hypothetical protein